MTDNLVERFREIISLSEQSLVWTVEDNRSPGEPDLSICADELLTRIEKLQAALLEAGEALGEARLIVANLPHDESLFLAKIDASLELIRLNTEGARAAPAPGQDG